MTAILPWLARLSSDANAAGSSASGISFQITGRHLPAATSSHKAACASTTFFGSCIWYAPQNKPTTAMFFKSTRFILSSGIFPDAKPIIAGKLGDPTVADSPLVFPTPAMEKQFVAYYDPKGVEDQLKWTSIFDPIIQS